MNRSTLYSDEPKKLCWTLLYVFLIMASVAPVAIAGGIMLAPLRVVMNDGQRYSTVTVLNQDKEEPVRFNIRTIALRMNEKGKMIEPEELGPREVLAGRMLRFSPTTSILPAGGKQVIRLMAKKPANLPDGEYLTYLSVMPERLEGEKQVDGQAAGGGVSMQLKILVGVRIPIVIRHGNLTMEATPASLRLSRDPEGGLVAETLIERSGNRSCVLKAEVDHISGNNVAHCCPVRMRWYQRISA